MITERYRRDYQGEFVVLSAGWRYGLKSQTREWINNPIVNQHISGRAAVIGSDVDRAQFDYSILQRHRGGLHGKLKLQTYGSDQIWQQMRLDFYYSNSPTTISRLAKTDYSDHTVVYTTPRRCIANPTKFFPVPYGPRLSEIAVPAYLAAFDGHREIFMIGYSNDTQFGKKNWHNEISAVAKAYWKTNFIFVGTESNTPDQWRRHQNVKCMSYREFIIHCDI